MPNCIEKVVRKELWEYVLLLENTAKRQNNGNLTIFSALLYTLYLLGSVSYIYHMEGQDLTSLTV